MSVEQTARWYDDHAKVYAEVTQKSPSLMEVWGFLSYLLDKPRVLDAGCGAGCAVAVMQYYCSEVIGVDISKGLIRRAQRRYRGRKYKYGNFLHLNFPNEFFDGVWSHASLVHLEQLVDVQQATREFYRVLRPNGVVHILVKAQTGKEKVAMAGGKIFRFFTMNEVEQLLIQQRFSMLDLDRYTESERTIGGRHDTEWILALARK